MNTPLEVVATVSALAVAGAALFHVVRSTRGRQKASHWDDGTDYDDQLEAAREDSKAYRALCEDYWLRSSKLVSMARGAVVTTEIAEAEELASQNATKFKSWFQLAQGHEDALKRFTAYDKTDRAHQTQKSGELRMMVSHLEELMTAAELATAAVDMLERQLPGLIAFELEVRKAS